MTRPGRWGEDPDSNRPKIKLFAWNWWTVFGAIALALVVARAVLR